MQSAARHARMTAGKHSDLGDVIERNHAAVAAATCFRRDSLAAYSLPYQTKPLPRR